jgi:RNA polymerase sigma factor for flagellar operon FliA
MNFAAGAIWNLTMIDAPSWGDAQRSPAMSALVLQHLDLVRHIAAQLVRRLPNSIELDDLVQIGMVGLLETVARYECRNGSSFATFATQRIRGAMIDSLRRSDWGPRSLRRRLRDISVARQLLESRTGNVAKAPAIAASLGMTLTRYFRALQADNQAAEMSTDAPAPRESGGSSLEWTDGKLGLSEALEQEEIVRAIAAAIAKLPAQERVILSLYYDREILMRDIGTWFALSESRICQIHKRSIERVRAALLL